MPFGYFYFPLPAIAYSVLDVILPGAVAAKLIQLIGIALVPGGVWWVTRIFKESQSRSTLVAATVATVVFFPQKYPVGGDVSSTLVGEYSYAWGLGLGIIAVGMALLAIEGKIGYKRAGVWMALATLAHVNAVFALTFGAAVYALVLIAGKYRKRVRGMKSGMMLSGGGAGSSTGAGAAASRLIKAVLVAIGIGAFWFLPLYSMRGEVQGNNKLADLNFMYWFPGYIWKTILVVGMIGLILSVVRGSLVGKMFLYLTGGAAVVYEILTEWHSFDLWSGRCMPVIYTGLMVGVGEVLDFIYTRGVRKITRALAVGTALSLLIAGGVYQQTEVVKNISEWRLRSTSTWSGIGRGEGGVAAGERVEQLIAALQEVEPGRVLYGMSKDGYKIYGARDLNGEIVRRIENLGGASTFFHEGNRGRFALAYGTSASMVHPSGIEPGGKILGLDDFSVGVEMMRQFGIRYYVISDPELHELASSEKRLTLVKTIGDVKDGSNGFFEIYEIQDAAIVEAMAKEPGIVEILPLWGETTWDGKVKQWLGRVGREPFKGIYLVETAPDDISWQGQANYADAGVENIEVTDEKVSFTVKTTEIPVVVRMGYSPRWQVEGGRGVYHVAPHAMIVIPTENEVVLEYRHPIEERLGLLITISTLSWLVFSTRLKRRGTTS
jgi:hypothetical protein